MARPRIHPLAASAGERQAKTRASLTEAGGRVVQIHLTPAGAADLATWRERSGARSDREAIEQALAAALKRVQRPKPST